MTDDVLCVRVSPDGRLLAVALLDSTVRVFFADSLKFFLSLYGHKLPVLAMDLSSGGVGWGGWGGVARCRREHAIGRGRVGGWRAIHSAMAGVGGWRRGDREELDSVRSGRP